MSKISISKEALEKLSNNSLSEYEISVLERFLPENQLPKSKNKTKQKNETSQKKTNRIKPKKDPVAKANARYENALQKIKTSQPLSKKEFKELAKRGQTKNMPRIINRITSHKKLVTTVNIDHHTATFSCSSRKNRTNTINKAKSLGTQFNQGRKKSLEWNDNEARKLQKELKAIKTIKQNSNAFDRFALK